MMPPSPSRKRAEHAGRRAETLAALFLMLKLYRIRAMRVKTPVGEIDIIAGRAGTLVFVEVKARNKKTGLGEALEAVNRRRIVNAARHFLSRHPALADRPMRFDVIFLAPLAWPHHVTNAFPAS